jgi:hypothetical protein
VRAAHGSARQAGAPGRCARGAARPCSCARARPPGGAGAPAAPAPGLQRVHDTPRNDGSTDVTRAPPLEAQRTRAEAREASGGARRWTSWARRRHAARRAPAPSSKGLARARAARSARRRWTRWARRRGMRARACCSRPAGAASPRASARGGTPGWPASRSGSRRPDPSSRCVLRSRVAGREWGRALPVLPAGTARAPVAGSAVAPGALAAGRPILARWPHAAWAVALKPPVLGASCGRLTPGEGLTTLLRAQAARMQSVACAGSPTGPGRTVLWTSFLSCVCCIWCIVALSGFLRSLNARHALRRRVTPCPPRLAQLSCCMQGLHGDAICLLVHVFTGAPAYK